MDEGNRGTGGADERSTAEPRCAEVWDVGSWNAQPPRRYRLNTSFRPSHGAVITLSGRVGGPAVAAELGVALRPFERLNCTIVVDVCHAELGEEATRSLVEIGLRHATGSGAYSFAIVHADPASRRRLEGAGGQLLLRPPGARPPRPTADTSPPRTG